MRIFAQGWSNGFDGPGRRRIYYLKGCNFKCSWCANPESISPEQEILFYPDRSEYAAKCCDKGAFQGEKLQRTRCADCDSKPCVNLWRSPAFELAGKEISIQEIIDAAISSRAMFGREGGITFGGGEPTMQMDELLETAARLRQNGVNTVVETNVSSSRFKELFDVFDLLICDLKCVSTGLHREMTGISNELVLENIRKALADGVNIIIRVPLIKELNFTISEQKNFYEFFQAVKPVKVEFLRLHQWGLPKYKALGQACPAENLHAPGEQAIKDLCKKLNAIDIQGVML